MCTVWSLGEGIDRNELSTKEIVDTVRTYKTFFNIERVRFWGGEPFLREDLTDVIEEISPLSFTEVITNGTLITPSTAEQIVKSGLHLISFSIDGPERHNDYLRGRGVFKKALTAIEILQEEKRRQEKKYPLIEIRPLITKKNYIQFKNLYCFVRKNGVGFRLIFLRDHYEALMKTFFDGKNIGYYQPSIEGQNVEIAKLVLSREECRKVWSLFYTLECNVKRNTFLDKVEQILEYIDSKLSSKIYFDCSRSRDGVMIDPWGGVYVCEFLHYQYGNCIVDGPSSWFSEKRTNIRERIIEGAFPICRECNKYGLYRPFFSTYYLFSRWYGFLFHNNPPNPPKPKTGWFRIRRLRENSNLL